MAKGKVVTLRVTQEEYAAWSACAELMGWTLSEWIRKGTENILGYYYIHQPAGERYNEWGIPEKVPETWAVKR